MDQCRGDSPRDDVSDGTKLDMPIDESTVSVPLLLNPTYARSKSIIFDELRNIRICLKWCALDHSTPTSKAVSYTAFVVLTFLVPALISLSVHEPVSTTSSSPPPSLVSFNKLVQLPETSLAAISFFTIAVFFRRYGLRQLLFLDGALRDDSAFVRHGYSCELDRAFKQLTCILLPSLSVELAHKILFFSSASVSVPARFALPGLPWRSLAFLVTLMSWVYRTGVFLLVCVLFRLTCELQILRFEGFYKMFEEGSCVSNAQVIFWEHVRIKKQLLLTSHRYRIFIIGSMVTITVSQLGALLLAFSSGTQKNFRNSGDVVVCSALQLSGFFMCLLGAARITHRAQRVVSIASRWHMAMSCTAKLMPGAEDDDELHAPNPGSAPKLTPASPALAYSASDRDASSSEHRQALVTYLQHNGGGITLFGFALDRGLLHTLFAFEMTLVLWILSKVVVLS